MTLTRTGLSRDVVASEALALTDRGGLGELSMRKLGQQLGVEAMSLYHYVANKDDLLDAILDQLYAEIELPRDVPDDDWEQAIRRGLRAFHDVLVRHQAALPLFAGRPARSAEALEVLMWAHNRFVLVGLAPEQAHHAVHFAVAFVMGHAATELGTMALLKSGADVDPGDIADPVAAEFVRQTRTVSRDDQFEAGLESVVAGLRTAYDLP
jgi:AcrR family transcriptional regulator